MTWKLTSWGQTRQPLSGVPWRDLSDEEFAAVEGRYPEIRERGYFEETGAADSLPRNLESYSEPFGEEDDDDD